MNSLIKIEYRRKYGIVSDSTPYGRFGVSEGYHVATDVFYYGFIVQCRILFLKDQILIFLYGVI